MDFQVPGPIIVNPLKPNKGGLHGSQVLSPKFPKSLEVNSAILTIERMEVGTYHFKWTPKSQVT
jgi:hypothetical protein